jgi:hypothetical protein
LTFDERLARDNAHVPVIGIESDEELDVDTDQSAAMAGERESDEERIAPGLHYHCDSSDDLEADIPEDLSISLPKYLCKSCNCRVQPDQLQACASPITVSVQLGKTGTLALAGTHTLCTANTPTCWIPNEHVILLDDGTDCVVAELHEAVATELFPHLLPLGTAATREPGRCDPNADAAVVSCLQPHTSTRRIGRCIDMLIGKDYRVTLTCAATAAHARGFDRVRWRVDACVPAATSRSAVLTTKVLLAHALR